MTDIDIQRLRQAAEEKKSWSRAPCADGCIYEHMYCAVLALIERLEKAEAQRDRLWLEANR